MLSRPGVSSNPGIEYPRMISVGTRGRGETMTQMKSAVFAALYGRSTGRFICADGNEQSPQFANQLSCHQALA